MVFRVNLFDDSCHEESVEIAHNPIILDPHLLQMEIFVVCVEFDVFVVLGEFVGVVLHELKKVGVVVGFNAEWDYLVD